MSFPNTTVRAIIIKFWKLPEDESVTLMEVNDPVLYIGMTGIIRDPAKRIEGRYVEFEPYPREKTRWGLYCSPEKFMDPVTLPEECLEIGPLLASCSCKEFESSAPVVEVDKRIKMPFERLLVAFFESCKIRNDDLSRVGVSLHQLDMLKQPKKIESIAKKMVQGFEKMGTLDLFRNGMPSLKDIISRATEADRLPVEERNKLDNEHVLYITVYHGNNNSSLESYRAHCFWKMSTKGTEYVNSQRQKIESTMPSRHSVNHYEYMKSFLKKHKGKWAVYPIARMEKPDPSDGPSWHTWAEQAIISLYDAYHPGMRDMPWEGFSNPATFLPGQVASICTGIAALITASDAFSSFARPSFLASPGSESGLNWNSPILELNRAANGLCTGPERIRHEDDTSCWLYKGPPCRVDDNGDINDPNRLAVTLFPHRMPKNVKDAKENIQRLRLPLRKNHGGEWKVKDGDYVIPAVEIARPSTNPCHPCSYEKFDGVGLYDNFLETFRIAYRIEYTNADGNLETRYLTSDLSGSHGTKEQRDSMDEKWVQAISVLATFEDEWNRRPERVPASLIDEWPIRRHDIEPNFFAEGLRAAIPIKVKSDRLKRLTDRKTKKLWKRNLEAGWFPNVGTNWQQPFVIKEKSTSQPLEAGHTEKAGDGNVKCKETCRFVYDSTTALDPEEDT